MNSENLGNLVNHWSMNWVQFEDAVSHMCVCSSCCSIVVSNTRGDRFEPSYCNDKHFCYWIQRIQWKHLGKSQMSLGCSPSTIHHLFWITRKVIHHPHQMNVTFARVSQLRCTVCLVYFVGCSSDSSEDSTSSLPPGPVNRAVQHLREFRQGLAPVKK